MEIYFKKLVNFACFFRRKYLIPNLIRVLQFPKFNMTIRENHLKLVRAFLIIMFIGLSLYKFVQFTIEWCKSLYTKNVNKRFNQINIITCLF
jgi:hypothetical protein